MKKLPKAIMRTPDDVRVAAGGAKDEQEPAHSIDSNEPADDGAVPPVSPALVTGALAPVAPTRAEFDAGERLFHARAIVDRHATYAAVGGIIPALEVRLALLGEGTTRFHQVFLGPVLVQLRSEAFEI